MDALTEEQRNLKGAITRSAVIWGVVAGIVVALIAFWLLGNAPDWVRWGASVLLLGGVGVLTYRWRYNSGVAKAVCKKCGTAFGIREVTRSEHLLSSESKRKVEAGKPKSKLDNGTTKVTTWTEEKVEVTATDECFKCHDRTERKWTVTREKDRVETETAA